MSSFRLVAWNCRSGSIARRIADLNECSPDIVFLQECAPPVVAASVKGPVSFVALGIWARAPRYVDDVLCTLDAHAAVLRSGRAVVMGDLNSGTDLNGKRTLGAGHSRLVGALTDFGLVSAYHAYHEVEHGLETHATYYHQFKASRPWHIDFCFVPAAWADGLTKVEVLDGKEWASRSDHRPILVTVRTRGTN